MSAKRSWDVQPKRPKAAAPAPKPSKRVASKEKAVRKRALPTGTLKERRKRKRSLARYVIGAVVLTLLSAVITLLWQPFLRVQEVSAKGPAEDTVAQIARSQLYGTYYFVLPRNSVFLLPEDDIREAVLDAHPEIAAISLSRTSFTTLQVTATARANTFIWCGAVIDPNTPSYDCYDVDIEGLIFKQADGASSSATSSTGTKLRVYAPLDRELPEGASPIRAKVQSASMLPSAVKFVGAVRELGVPVSALSFRGDEADLWLPGPTRITYVLGREQAAATLAASVLPTLDLADGTIEYVDLRFNGKAYVRRYGEAVGEESVGI